METSTRRKFLARLTGAAVTLGSVLVGWPLIRSLVPNVLYEPPTRFSVGLPEQLQQGVTFLEKHRVYLFREGNSVHAVSGVCTHLGCTVKFAPSRIKEQKTVRNVTFNSIGEFHCPCHGSRFHGEGTNYSGPAPRPLKCLHLEISSARGELVVDLAREVDREFRLVV